MGIALLLVTCLTFGIIAYSLYYFEHGGSN